MDSEGIALSLLHINEPGDVQGWLEASPGKSSSADRLIDAGFGDRILFGSDTRPAAPILRRLEKITWLTEQQRRAILYDNAARFMRLDIQTIACHHGADRE